ncbi:metallophosphoesterase family protein, partial [Candidatus Riflebacteria bacterium]
YGPNPNSTMDRINEFPNISVYGNHDIVACEVNAPTNFNLYAYTVIMWTRKVLTQKNKNLLANLPYPHIQGDFCFSHGNHESCEEYVMSKDAAIPIFKFLKSKNNGAEKGPSFCFIGHTHYPIIYKVAKTQVEEDNFEEMTQFHPEEYPHEFTLDLDYYYVTNIGSVGQPRDHDPRSSYTVLDTRDGAYKISMRRLEYNIRNTQETMEEFGLPAPMINRLSKGI